VSSKAPFAILDQAVADHPASRAWGRLDDRGRPPRQVEVWREQPTNQPASIYRLVFGDGGMPPVFAKHSDPRFGSVERACYETIVPRVGVTSHRFHGALTDPDGSYWLFLEDAGRTWYSLRDPEHRVLAGSWIGRLHREGARVAAASNLPAGAPGRYLAHLRAARDRMTRHFANPSLTDGDRDVLRRVLAILDVVESRWEPIVRALAGPPATFVHGDLQPKNVRIRPASSGPEVCVIDWEMAGWGNPAIDLAPSSGSDVSIQVDPEAYAAEVCDAWPGVDAAAIRRLSVLGMVMRRLAGMDWATESLHFREVENLADPVATLASLHRSLSRALEAAGEWIA
jgi:hypothetical protein